MANYIVLLKLQVLSLITESNSLFRDKVILHNSGLKQ